MNGPWRLVHRVQVRLVVLCVSVVLLGGLPALAKDVEGPSAKETLKFIQETMLSCGEFTLTDQESKLKILEKLIKRVEVKSPWMIEIEARYRIIRPYEINNVGGWSYGYDRGSENIDVMDLTNMSPEVIVDKNSQGLDFLTVSCRQGACATTSKRKLKIFVDESYSSKIQESKKRCVQVNYYACGYTSAFDVPLKENPIEDSPPVNTDEQSFTWFMCNEQTTQSLAKAFRHAITLAGGKKPLF